MATDNTDFDGGPDIESDSDFFRMANGDLTVVREEDIYKQIPSEKAPHLEEVRRYWTDPPNSFALICRSKKSNEYEYYAIEPSLTKHERRLVKFLQLQLRKDIDYSEFDVSSSNQEQQEQIREMLEELLTRYGLVHDTVFSGNVEEDGDPGLTDRLIVGITKQIQSYVSDEIDEVDTSDSPDFTQRPGALPDTDAPSASESGDSNGETASDDGLEGEELEDGAVAVEEGTQDDDPDNSDSDDVDEDDGGFLSFFSRSSSGSEAESGEDENEGSPSKNGDGRGSDGEADEPGAAVEESAGDEQRAAELVKGVSYANDTALSPDDEITQEMSRSILGANLSAEQIDKIEYYILRNLTRLGKLEPLMNDDNIEDIHVNGWDSAAFIYHSDYSGNLMTDVEYAEEDLDTLVNNEVEKAGKGISQRQPMVDVTLDDGSRAQFTLDDEVTTKGTNLTIRRFDDVPRTPIDLINWNTYSIEQMVFLWLCMENDKNLLLSGGTASGKTTTMNALSLFIKSSAKIVSIEDTPELELPHENWVQSITREESSDTMANIDEFSLLKASWRQRPTYIIMGEVRGEEAKTLFQAMSSGHSTMSTMHASTPEEVRDRLTGDPINLGEPIIGNLDLVCTQAAVPRGDGQKVRRSRKIAEIESDADSVTVDTIYEWNAYDDSWERAEATRVLAEIRELNGWGSEELKYEMFKRKVILSYMVRHGINSYREVSGVLQAALHDIDAVVHLALTDQLKEVAGEFTQMGAIEIEITEEEEAQVNRPTPDKGLLEQAVANIEKGTELLEHLLDEKHGRAFEAIIREASPDRKPESGSIDAAEAPDANAAPADTSATAHDEACDTGADGTDGEATTTDHPLDTGTDPFEDATTEEASTPDDAATDTSDTGTSDTRMFEEEPDQTASDGLEDLFGPVEGDGDGGEESNAGGDSTADTGSPDSEVVPDIETQAEFEEETRADPEDNPETGGGSGEATADADDGETETDPFEEAGDTGSNDASHPIIESDDELPNIVDDDPSDSEAQDEHVDVDATAEDVEGSDDVTAEPASELDPSEMTSRASEETDHHQGQPFESDEDESTVEDAETNVESDGDDIGLGDLTVPEEDEDEGGLTDEDEEEIEEAYDGTVYGEDDTAGGSGGGAAENGRGSSNSAPTTKPDEPLSAYPVENEKKLLEEVIADGDNLNPSDCLGIPETGDGQCGKHQSNEDGEFTCHWHDAEDIPEQTRRNLIEAGLLAEPGRFVEGGD